MEILPRKRFIETMKFARLYNQTRPDKNTSNPSLYELYLTSNLWVAFFKLVGGIHSCTLLTSNVIEESDPQV